MSAARDLAAEAIWWLDTPGADLADLFPAWDEPSDEPALIYDRLVLERKRSQWTTEIVRGVYS